MMSNKRFTFRQDTGPGMLVRHSVVVASLIAVIATLADYLDGRLERRRAGYALATM
jgi:hypothetical protein